MKFTTPDAMSTDLLPSADSMINFSYIDGLDAALVPATGTPVPGGLTFWHVIQTIESVFASCDVISADVNEIVPQEGSPLTQFTAAMIATKIVAAHIANMR